MIFVQALPFERPAAQGFALLVASMLASFLLVWQPPPL